MNNKIGVSVLFALVFGMLFLQSAAAGSLTNTVVTWNAIIDVGQVSVINTIIGNTGVIASLPFVGMGTGKVAVRRRESDADAAKLAMGTWSGAAPFTTTRTSSTGTQSGA